MRERERVGGRDRERQKEGTTERQRKTKKQLFVSFQAGYNGKFYEDFYRVVVQVKFNREILFEA
jgi:hypothetical protein